jgi:hypothetical protein
MTYDEMPEQTQEAVDRRAEVYSNQTFENGTVDDEDVALFYVGEDTMVDDVLGAVDYTDDNSGVIEGNVTAAAIEQVADEVLEATDAEVAVVYDATDETTVYNKPLETDGIVDRGATPLDVVQGIGEHYEDVETERRATEFQNQLESALSQTDPEVAQTVLDARQEAFEARQRYEQDEDVEHPEALAQRDMMQSIDDSQVDNERVNEALESVDVNTDPVFARTMSSGYHMSRLEEKREQMQ